jgi:hypothetical protein
MGSASVRLATITSCSTRTEGSFAWTFRSFAHTSFVSPRALADSKRSPSDTTAGGRNTLNPITVAPVALARSWATRNAS